MRAFLTEKEESEGIIMQKQPFPKYRTENYKIDDIFLVDPLLTLEPHYDYMHSHNVCEIGIAVSGSGTVMINDRVLPFNPGDISVIFPGDMHISNSIDNNKNTWSYINIDIDKMIVRSPGILSGIEDILSSKKQLSNVFTPELHPTIVNYVNRLFNELIEKSYGYKSLCQYLFAAIMIDVYRISTETVPAENKKHMAPIIPALSYISLHYSENITSSKLAEICYISQTHLRRLFKEYTGISPLEYVYKARITAATALLKTSSMSILDIAYAVGYSTQTSFNSHFKRFTGTTPSKYRTENKTTEN